MRADLFLERPVINRSLLTNARACDVVEDCPTQNFELINIDFPDV